MRITNCSFKYRCDNKWEDLDKTDQPKIRYCRECDRGVHHCDNKTEYQEALKSKRCIALSSESKDETNYVLGVPRMPRMEIE